MQVRSGRVAAAFVGFWIALASSGVIAQAPAEGRQPPDDPQPPTVPEDESVPEPEAPPSRPEPSMAEVLDALRAAEAAAESAREEAAAARAEAAEAREDAEAAREATRDANNEPGRADIPLDIALHGYYRARYAWFGNVPLSRTVGPRNDAGNAHFAFQRLRLEPEVRYGNPDRAIAALKVQIDALDNVVFGDNARITRTPIFAADPSYTDYEGFDLQDSFRLERAWLEVLVPVGQIRVGRMPSQWGMGLLAHDGNGLGEWGDPLFGTTFDRVLFATRPISVVNALTSGDARPTPLIYAVAYDKLVEDPVRAGTDPPDPDTIRTGPFGPIGTVPDERSTIPFQAWVGENNDVNQMAHALIWRDQDFGRAPEDELTVGGYYVYRWQRRGGALRPLPEDQQASRVHILDAYWRFRYTPSSRMPSIFTEGEIVHIRGRTNTVSLAGGCDDDAGICNVANANLLGGAFRAGFIRERQYALIFETGFASGDGNLFNDPNLTVRPLHPDHHVGLLMYQVALSTMTSLGLGEPVRPLWSRGGVWNSVYVFPQLRYHVAKFLEVHAAFLTARADELLATVYVNERDDFTDTSCGPFDSDCRIGYEVDLAFRFKWGDNDLLRWDTEIGFMRTGNALLGEFGGLSQRFLWTVQSRMAMVF